MEYTLYFYEYNKISLDEILKIETISMWHAAQRQLLLFENFVSIFTDVDEVFSLN